MTHITLPRATVEQALEALLKSHTCPLLPDDCEEAITALRAALAQQAEPGGPVAWMDPATGDVISDARHEAWERDFGLAGKGKAALFTVPLYTAPPQQAGPVEEQSIVEKFNAAFDRLSFKGGDAVLIERRDSRLYMNDSEIGPGTLEIREDGVTYRSAALVDVRKPEQAEPVCPDCRGLGYDASGQLCACQQNPSFG